MLKTSKDLMEWLGLKVGDKIKTDFEYIDNKYADNKKFEITESVQGTIYLQSRTMQIDLAELIDNEFEILPKPKRVGDLTCGEINDCSNCPLQFVCNLFKYSFNEDNSLYNILTKIDVYDQEIYNILKARLDKEVEEE